MTHVSTLPLPKSFSKASPPLTLCQLITSQGSSPGLIQITVNGLIFSTLVFICGYAKLLNSCRLSFAKGNNLEQTNFCKLHEFSHNNSQKFLIKIQQWRNIYYQTFHGPIFHFLITFYFIYAVKCDQKVEYGTIKSSIIRISPL